MPYYHATSDDTLSDIGARFGVSSEQILAAPENVELRERDHRAPRVADGDLVWIPVADPAYLINRSPTPWQTDDSDEPRPCPTLHAGCPLVEEYKVRSGDSIKSVAEAHGMTWQELAIFNWDTDDPDQINWYLENYFICRKKKGANYVFTDEDEPGLLYLPHGVERAGQRVRRGVYYVSRWKQQ